MPTPRVSGPVLVGIDGTASGLDALALGRTLAALTEAPLVLGAVHGFETLVSLFGGPGWPTPEDAREWLRRASLAFGHDERVCLVATGADSVAHGLAALARQEGASLIVVGTSARSSAGRLRAGTGARRVVHDAGCPVAVAPPGWRAWPRPARPVFGVGVDAGGAASGALEWARALSTAAGAALEVLAAAEPAETARAREIAAAAAARVGAAAICVLGADPVECLTRTADRLDLLVVGARRRGPLRTALHTGVSTTLAGRTACPLLIVPAGASTPARAPRAEAVARV